MLLFCQKTLKFIIFYLFNNIGFVCDEVLEQRQNSQGLSQGLAEVRLSQTESERREGTFQPGSLVLPTQLVLLSEGSRPFC